tara:strand:- start:650 stop:937 length:288 start_codon:yes stop_codon:yes gene_type:complete
MTDLKYTDLQSVSWHSIRESIQSSINERRRINQEGDLANIIRYINGCGATSLSNRNVEWQGKSDMDKIKDIASAIMKPYERFIDLNQQVDSNQLS